MRFCVAVLTTSVLAQLAATAQTPSSSVAADVIESGRRQFNLRCSGCHGADGLGGERAPAIGAGERDDLHDDSAIRDLIRKGIPETGMPAFRLPDGELAAISTFVRSRVVPLWETPVSGDARKGAHLFFGAGGCSKCHMVWGQGGLDGPDLSEAGSKLSLAEVESALQRPNVGRKGGYEVATVRLGSGETIRGFIRNESAFDLQLQGFDHKLHLLTTAKIAAVERERESFMPPFRGTEQDMRDLIAFLARRDNANAVPSASPQAELPEGAAWNRILHPDLGEWPTYHGKLSGNRYSELTQITPANVSRLAPKWSFPVPESHGLEVTPVVADGVMYVTNVDTVYALDARSGRAIWRYSRPRSKDLVGDASGGINRGVALLGDRVFVVTDNAHLLALHRLTGGLLWDVEMADSRNHYGATSAPLVVHNLVISGVSGGDEGIRGFVSAYQADTGKRVWRFWTIPAPGEPEAKTWVGRALEHGCGAAWLTGTYDEATGSLFWPVGNPCPDFNGDERRGDNLYTDSVLALEPLSGKLKWSYQFTPHDLHDWDATETPMIVHAEYRGRLQTLLLQGNRNGFFYVLDGATGAFLNASPFVKKLTWASEIGADGRPRLADGWEPSIEGALVCPSMDGASNWMSTAYLPETGLFVLMALEKCNVFSKNSEWWKQGRSFYGGTARSLPDEQPRKYLRAIDVRTGQIAWDYEQPGRGETWGGLLATAAGLIFFGNNDGSFTAVDAKTGKPLWHFQLNAHWHASPMTFAVDGKQYLAIAAGNNIVTFGLVE